MNDLTEVYQNVSAVKMIHMSLSWRSDFSVFHALKWLNSKKKYSSILQDINTFRRDVLILFSCFPCSKCSRKYGSNKINGNIGTKRVRGRVQISFLILNEFIKYCSWNNQKTVGFLMISREKLINLPKFA